MLYDRKLLWGPIFVVDYEYSDGVGVFFGGHSSPMNSF